ncbi:hypothetical protein BIW11_06560 [Tropilaelaps mercedesae]|uniref:Uncharacterized protein n=1 Tax=Tropilaelaps mercedesae TaxID=418985 RepID=A0A1V9XXK9_9ACAR|nr:hypothetical protein BIW11_06560 [Tropilaelaps mercedesae]
MNDRGIVVIPKSVTPSRIEANPDIFDSKPNVKNIKRLRHLIERTASAVFKITRATCTIHSTFRPKESGSNRNIRRLVILLIPNGAYNEQMAAVSTTRGHSLYHSMISLQLFTR